MKSANEKFRLSHVWILSIVFAFSGCLEGEFAWKEITDSSESGSVEAGMSISAPSLTETNSVDVSFTINYADVETITLTNSDITLIPTGDALGTINVSGSGSDSRTVMISGISGDGTLGIQVASGTATSSSGDAVDGALSDSFTVDNVGPGIVINAPSVSETVSGPVTFLVNYPTADNVDLSSSDITLIKTGDADGIVSSITGSGTSRTVTVNTIIGNGSIGLSIIGGAQDTLGNSSAGGFSSTFWVTGLSSTDQYAMTENIKGIEDMGTLYDSGGQFGNYPDNELSTFLIQPASNPDIITLTDSFIDFATGDTLTVYDGTDNTGTLITTITFGGENSFNAYSGAMYLEFYSDAVSNATGMTVYWTSSTLSASEYVLCQDLVSNAENGTLYDSGGPNGNYNGSDRCGILIQPATGDPYVKLSFSQMALEDLEDFYDPIQIYDGIDETGIPLHTGDGFVGFTLPPDVTANSGSMYVILKADFKDEFYTYAGFTATWTTTAIPGPPPSNGNVMPLNGTGYNYDTSGTLFDSGGEFTNYYDNENSGYYIQPFVPLDITVTTANIDMFDYLMIYDGGSVIFDSNVHPPGTYSAPFGDVYVELGSDSVGTLSGFELSWNLASGGGANSMILNDFDFSFATSGTLFDSGGEFGNYSNNEYSEYYIQPFSALDINVNMVNMDMFDYLTIYDNGSVIFDSNIHPPGTYSAPFGDVYVVLGSDSSGTLSGFDMTWNLAGGGGGELTICNDTFSSDLTGTLFDSGGSSGNYGPLETYSSCYFLIQTGTANIDLFLSMVNLGPGENIWIYDGTFYTDPMLYGGDGSAPPASVTAYSGSMYIEFESDGAIEGPGFQYDWNAY